MVPDIERAYLLKELGVRIKESPVNDPTYSFIKMHNEMMLHSVATEQHLRELHSGRPALRERVLLSSGDMLIAAGKRLRESACRKPAIV